MPVRCSTPCTTASSGSSVCSGHITTSPSSRGPAAMPASSTGNDSTSVGPLRPRCSRLSSAIRSAATNSTAMCPSSMPADAAASAHASTIRASGSASPITSTSNKLGRAAALGRPQLLGRALLVLVVRGDDPLHELVADDVLAAEVDELDAVDALEDVVDHDQPRFLVARQVDLRDVAGHDHPGAKPEPREE